MTHRQNILDAISKEITICKQLFKKLPEGGISFKPADNMRSTEELLRYISMSAVLTLKYFTLEQNRENMASNRTAFVEKANTFDITEFPRIMDEQLQEIEELFKNISDEDLLTKTIMMPWGEEMSLERGILEGPLKWLAGYKMQLFLYAKIAGNSALNTRDCWVGSEPEVAATA